MFEKERCGRKGGMGKRGVGKKAYKRKGETPRTVVVVMWMWGRGVPGAGERYVEMERPRRGLCFWSSDAYPGKDILEFGEGGEASPRPISNFF